MDTRSGPHSQGHASTYARRLGLFSATMAVIGGIIGSGIFRNPAVVVARVKTPGLTLLTWSLGALVALCGAFCFAELGARKPRAGGSYVYLRDAFGPLPAFLYGWALFTIISTGATAGVAMTFAGYAQPLLGLPPRAVPALAVSAIVLLSVVNYVGVRPGAIAQNVFTVLKLLGLAFLIFVGLLAKAPVTFPSAVAPSGASSTVWAVGTALVPVLFSFGGWQQTNFIAEEMVDAPKNLPRALTLGVLSVVAIYLAANFAYLRMLGPIALATSQAPAAEVLHRVFGQTGATLIAAAIAASTFGFLGLVIMVTPRVYQAIAADGLFLPAFAKLHPKHRTPSLAIVLQAVWSTTLALTGSYDQLVDYVVFGDWIFFGLTAASLFVYRGRDLETSEGFRTPGYPVVPGLFVLAALYVVVSSVAANPRNALIGAGLLATGIPAFYFWRARTKRPNAN